MSASVANVGGKVRVRVGADGLVLEGAVVAGTVRGLASAASQVRVRAAVAGKVRTSPLVTGAILGRCV